MQIYSHFEEVFKKDMEVNYMPTNKNAMKENITVEKLYKILEPLVQNGKGDLPISINGFPLCVDFGKDLEAFIGVDIKIPGYYSI